jgi:hypothetical protein
MPGLANLMIEQIPSRGLPTHAETGQEEFAWYFGWYSGFPCLQNPEDLRKYQPSLETWLAIKRPQPKNPIEPPATYENKICLPGAGALPFNFPGPDRLGSKLHH